MSELSTPLFSVIIPTHGRQSMLDVAVASVLDQTCDSFELIVIDDASPEPARATDDPRIRLLRQAENQGQAAALNLGIRTAKGKYVAFLDDDDSWSPRRLENATRGHLSGDVVICGMRRTRVFPRGRIARQPGDFAQRIPDAILKSRELIAPMGQISIRRDLCLRVLPDESYRASHDLDWGIRLTSQNGVRFVSYVDQDWQWGRHSGARHLNGQDQRIAGGQRLLLEHADWYQENPRARAFRLYRLGVMSLSVGQRQQAMKYLARSLAVRPQPRRLALAARIATSFGKGGS